MGRTACTEPQCLYKGALYTLLKGISPSPALFDLSFQFANLLLLISICKQFHHLFFGRPLNRLPRGLLLKLDLLSFYYPFC